MKKFYIIFLVTVIALFTAACGTTKNEQDTANKKTLNIYTTVYPLQYFAKRIGGSHVNVSSIYPPGSNEHTFEPTQRDMMNLADADYFFYVGLGLEGFVEKSKKSLQNEQVQMVETAAQVSKDKLVVSTGKEEDEHEGNHEDGHEHGQYDPHVWLSPVISQDLAKSIKNALVKAQPKNKSEFETNYESLVKDLNKLNNDYKTMANNAKHKTFFVSHAAFGYIAGTYGLNQVAIAGLNSQDEPSQKTLAHIVDQAKEDNVRYILFEQNVSSNLAKVIQNDIGAQPLTLHNLSVLTKEDIQHKEDYFTLMQRNIDTFKKALN